ncbi:MAG: hypothetical protein RIB58_11560 [Phycisphaerales bacterium]
MASAVEEASRLRDRWPGLIIHFPYEEDWGGAEIVTGERMTTRPTARQALEDWLFEHGEVFGRGSRDFEITHVTEWGEDRTFMRFVQTIDGLDGPISAPESYGRAMAHKDDEGNWSLSYVRTAALNVPDGGLPQRLIHGPQARSIAETLSRPRPQGEEIDWTEPVLELVPSGLDVSESDPREARQAWSMIGRDPTGRGDTLYVLIDAVTGEVLAERQGSFNFADDVSGSVTGLVLMGDEPYETGLECIDFVLAEDTTNVPIANMLVELADQPGGTAVASTYTDDLGDYAFLGVTLTPTSVVRFVPDHAHFRLGRDIAFTSPVPWAPSSEVAPDASGTADFVYATTTGVDPEARISDMTAWTVVESARAFYKVQNQHIPGIDDDDLIVAPNSTNTLSGGARFYAPGYHLGTSLPMITFKPEFVGSKPPFAYPTIIAHEYGHFALWEAFGVQGDGTVFGIHEGYADILSLLYVEPGGDIVGFGSGGCVSPTQPRHGRNYEVIDATWSTARNCNLSHYDRGDQLVLAWRKIRDLMWSGYPADPENVRKLFVAWSFLATPEPHPRWCFVHGPRLTDAYDLSARDTTVLEVLAADDDDGFLNNGTPHFDAICQGFERVMLPTGFTLNCPDSAGVARCRVDFDRDGRFTMYDLVTLKQWLIAGDLRADVNGDGHADRLDFIAAIELSIECP